MSTHSLSRVPAKLDSSFLTVFDFKFERCDPQKQSLFFSKLPLELREECYRHHLATFNTPYGLPYVDKDIYFLPALTGARVTGAQGHGRTYQDLLRTATSCRQMYSEFMNMLFREQSYLVDPDIDDEEWFVRTQRHIRRAAITFSVQAGKEKADLAKRRVRQLASDFEGGRHLRELGIHLWGRWSDAADPEGILQVIAESFRVPKVWVVDNHVLFGAQFFTDEQLRVLKDSVEGSAVSFDWAEINARAAKRIAQMEEETDADPEKHKLKRPQPSHETGVASKSREPSCMYV